MKSLSSDISSSVLKTGVEIQVKNDVSHVGRIPLNCFLPVDTEAAARPQLSWQLSSKYSEAERDGISCCAGCNCIDSHWKIFQIDAG